jgi:hypothetical protein
MIREISIFKSVDFYKNLPTTNYFYYLDFYRPSLKVACWLSAERALAGEVDPYWYYRLHKDLCFNVSWQETSDEMITFQMNVEVLDNLEISKEEIEHILEDFVLNINTHYEKR